jgi:dienelactone hydrolase
VYPRAGHRFMTESAGAGAALAKIARMSFQPEDAADAWQRIFGFFGTYL